jgi:hypothetical protein
LSRRRHSARAWLWVAALVALIVGPLILYRVLPRFGVPAALVSGIVGVVVLKHLGLLAVVLTPLYALLRQRRRR